MLILLPLAPPLHLPCLPLHLLLLLTLLFPSVKLPPNGANRLLLLSNIEVPLVLIFFLHLLSLLLILSSVTLSAPSSTLQLLLPTYPHHGNVLPSDLSTKEEIVPFHPIHCPISLFPVPSNAGMTCQFQRGYQLHCGFKLCKQLYYIMRRRVTRRLRDLSITS